MDLPFELFVAVRYLLARRKQAFISLISFISALGVGLGVMALLIALALMTGLQGELRDRLVGSAAHVYVYKAGGLTDPEREVRRMRELPGVTAAAPVLLGMALVQSADNSLPITIKGVIPALEAEVTEVERSLQAGSLDRLADAPDTTAGIVIGRELAQKLNVYVGDRISVLTPEGVLTPAGLMPRTRTFEVVGIFGLGLYEYDAAYGFVHLEVAKRLFGETRPHFVELRVADLFGARQVAEGIPGRLGPEYSAQDWMDMNRALFSALWLEKVALAITIGLIVMVAAMNIIASLVLLVMEKNRDIAILKTMGSSAVSIRRIFILQGLIIGLFGTAAGAIGGLSVIHLLDRYELIRIPIDVYQISHVPFRLHPQDFLIVVVTAVLICLVATIYPSRQAAKLDPAQALRYQ